jgi:tetratricopeptide (TPR) repeat protein
MYGQTRSTSASQTVTVPPAVPPAAAKDTSVSAADSTARALIENAKKLQEAAKDEAKKIIGKADSIVQSYKSKAEAELKKLDDKSKEVEADVNKILGDTQDAARDAEDFVKRLGRILDPANFKFLNDTSSVGRAVNNFTAYFNTYYNAQRLMLITEDEFAFQDEQKRVKPRIVITEQHTLQDDQPDRSELPGFLEVYVVSPERLQPVREPVDSILIKGSKILTRHGKSNYVDGMLFLMAKAFFFKQEWFPAQVKCEELIKMFPYSTYSPDAHLLLAKSLLMQRRFPDGYNALSRTVDIAWGQKRYDVLSEAFKIQADLSLYLDKPEEATKPYRRAIAQADDPVQQARWQVDLGVLLYRLRQYEAAERELKRVAGLSSADALAVFEAQLYRAASLARLKRYESSDSLFTVLEGNRAFTNWRPWIYGERINLFRQTQVQSSLDSMNIVADTVASERLPIAAANYQRGIWELKRGNEKQAALQFQKSLIEKAPNYARSKQYNVLMKRIEPLPTELQRLREIERQDSIALLPANRQRDSLFTLLLASAPAAGSATSSDAGSAVNSAVNSATGSAANSAANSAVNSTTNSTVNSTNAALRLAQQREAQRDSVRFARAEADSNRAELALALFHIGRANERLGRPDSARSIYSKAVRVSPLADTTRARYLHAEARLTGFGERRSTPARKRSDSLLAEIVQRYSRTQFAADARVRLGAAEAPLDSAEALFLAMNASISAALNASPAAQNSSNQSSSSSSSSSSQSGVRVASAATSTAYRKRIADHADQIVAQYPRSGFAPRSLYMAGWAFEQQRQRDSAISYYKQLLKRYPSSSYAQEVKPMVEEIDAFRIAEQRRLDSLRFIDSMVAVVRADSLRAVREVQLELERERELKAKEGKKDAPAKGAVPASPASPSGSTPASTPTATSGSTPENTPLPLKDAPKDTSKDAPKKESFRAESRKEESPKNSAKTDPLKKD